MRLPFHWAWIAAYAAVVAWAYIMILAGKPRRGRAN